ncbi:transporter [Nocardia sp. NPDC059091]|uniref:transporter n=1 Tax=Nocardia sp. NPDC059091 TaxID=3346724 RepID=UPI0036928BE2
MAIKDALFALADIWMLVSGFVFGVKFIRNYSNYLLGIEWIIVATSGTNFLVYSLLGGDENSPMYAFAHFLDAFSRSVGFTLILVLGLMKVTHRYKPSVPMDIGAFALAAAVGFFLHAYADRFEVAAAVFYLLANVLTSLFLAYFTSRLWTAGLKKIAVRTGVATAAGFLIAAIYDFVPIPGDDQAHTYFYIAALTVWGFQLRTYYFGYRALDADSASRETPPSVGVGSPA